MTEPTSGGGEPRDSVPGAPDAAVPGELRARVIQGATYYAARLLLGNGVNVFAMFCVNKLIGVGNFGLAQPPMLVYGVLTEIFPLGIGTYLVRKPGDLDRESCNQAFTCMLLMAVLGLVFGLGSVPLIQQVLGVKGDFAEFTKLAPILFCALPFNVLATYSQSLIERKLDFRRVAFIELCAQVASNLVAIAVAVVTYRRDPLHQTTAGAYALIFGWSTKEVVAFALLVPQLEFWPRLRWDKKQIREIVAYGFSFSLANWTWQLRYLLNALVVAPILGKEVFGCVQFAVRLVQQFNIVGVAMRRLSISAFAKLTSHIGRLTNAHSEAMTLQVLATGPVLLVLSLAGPLIVTLLGPKWAGAFAIYPWVALSAVVDSSFSLHAYVLFALGRNSRVTLFHVVRVTLFALGALLFLEKYGLTGYGYAEALTFLSYPIVHIYLTLEGVKPRYLTSLVFQITFGFALFWRELGWPVALAPLATLLWPQTWALGRRYLWSLRFRRSPWSAAGSPSSVQPPPPDIGTIHPFPAPGENSTPPAPTAPPAVNGTGTGTAPTSKEPSNTDS